MIVVLCDLHIGIQGAKPNSRKFLGCSYAQDRFYFFGGVAMELLNDLRSFNLSAQRWTIESENDDNYKGSK